MTTYQHGIVTTESGSYGLYTDISADYSEELAEARDADGDVAVLQGYNETIEVKVACVFDTTKTLPTVGSTVTLAAGKTTGAFRVTHMSLSETNTGFTTFTMDLKRWVTNSLPAS